MIKIKPIGIRNDRSWLLPIFIIGTVSLIFATIIFWVLYNEEFKYENIVKNGVEVEATVTSYNYHYGSSDDNDADGWYYIWECNYNGRNYSGSSRYFKTKEEVSDYIGKKFTVTVDPNSNWSVNKPLAEIRPNGFYFKEYKTGAIIFTCISPIIILVLALLILYPLILDYKIDRCGKLPIRGEVLKVAGLIIKYVKVSYEYKGTTYERWSRSWVTIREAKYLEQKKDIQIVLYKKTFGILEEMQIIKNRKKV